MTIAKFRFWSKSLALLVALISGCGDDDEPSPSGTGGKATTMGGRAAHAGAGVGASAIHGGPGGTGGTGGDGGAETHAGGRSEDAGAAGLSTSNQGGSSQGGLSSSDRGGTPNMGGTGALTGGGRAAGGSTAVAEAGAGGEGGDPGPITGTWGKMLRFPVPKLDLLIAIGSSSSMGDKQAILADAVGELLRLYAAPACVDRAGKPTGERASPEGTCARGAAEFTPLRDIHLAVVSSNLGGHGASKACESPGQDDHGQLVQVIRPDSTIPTWNSSGFLNWDPSSKSTPPGSTSLDVTAGQFANLVRAVGDSGCQYESLLESWYRFLVDPEPIISTPVVSGTSPDNTTRPHYTDTADNPVLMQRAQFLRPDSAVTIVMVSDKNDCSIIDSDWGWLVGLQSLNTIRFTMPRSTSACDINPNDPCCNTCIAATVAAGCPALSADPNCAAGKYLDAARDAFTLRCYEEKRRFGVDWLYPVERYAQGLRSSYVLNRRGVSVPNPLLTWRRPPGSVTLTGIVGVPWQDLAKNANASVLEYKAARDIDWRLILGTAGTATAPATPPTDRLMVETPHDRTSQYGAAPHPILGTAAALAPSISTGRPNAINGRENTVLNGVEDELQYACIFPLPTAKPCSGSDPRCECNPIDANRNRAVCNGATQAYAKAYPGLRQLDVLQRASAPLSDGTPPPRTAVASICPKTLTPGATDYGYRPAMRTTVDASASLFKPDCLPRALPVADAENRTTCSLYEIGEEASQCPPCDTANGRYPISATAQGDIYRFLMENNHCTRVGTNGWICGSVCACEIRQLSGADLTECRGSQQPKVSTPGFCYVDPTTARTPDERTAQETLLTQCDPKQKRYVRLVGGDLPNITRRNILICGGGTDVIMRP